MGTEYSIVNKRTWECFDIGKRFPSELKRDKDWLYDPITLAERVKERYGEYDRYKPFIASEVEECPYCQWLTSKIQLFIANVKDEDEIEVVSDHAKFELEEMPNWTVRSFETVGSCYCSDWNDDQFVGFEIDRRNTAILNETRNNQIEVAKNGTKT